MRRSYWQYLLCLSASLFLIGTIYGLLASIFMVHESGDWKKFFLLDTLGGVFGVAIVIFLYLLPALLLASIIRWALQKYKVIAFCCNLLLFHMYIYVVYVRQIQNLTERVFDIPKDTLEYDVYLWVFFHTFVLLVISEFFIFKRDKKRQINR